MAVVIIISGFWLVLLPLLTLFISISRRGTDSLTFPLNGATKLRLRKAVTKDLWCIRGNNKFPHRHHLFIVFLSGLFKIKKYYS